MNAKDEFIKHTESRVVKCARVCLKDEEEIILLENYSIVEYDEFLSKLNFEYYNGFGGQELFGTIWYRTTGEWSSRGEYDGSEWWEFCKCPPVPKHLRRP